MIAILNENIISKFGTPDSIVFDNAKYFSFVKLTEFSLEYGIKLKHSMNYYPQGNGLFEYTNKNLVNIIKKTVDQNPRCWHAKLLLALWADRITPKASIKSSLFSWCMVKWQFYLHTFSCHLSSCPSLSKRQNAP